jgi:hypothetical protein
MIRSGLDACPFGLAGYGFDQYTTGSPGNAVLALARYWLDNAALIAAVEHAHPDRCHRVRYEDLVEDPEAVMRDVYAFVGVQHVPGVARACFSSERERFGPADHKIWATTSVSRDSVGRGELVPAGLIPPPVTAAINELAGKLGYLPVDEGWGTPGRPTDPRVPGTIRRPVPPPRDEPPPGSGPLLDMLRSRIQGTDDQFASQWQSRAAGNFLVVSRAPGDGSEAQWVVNPATRTITADDKQADSDVEWSVLGSPETWQEVLNGHVNLYAALRRCDLRYCASGEDSPLVMQTRVAMFANLLGLGSRELADAVSEDTAGLAAAVAS